VAFINFSGVQLLLDVFSKLENKNIKGKILTSTYLNFTQIKALEKLKKKYLGTTIIQPLN